MERVNGEDNFGKFMLVAGKCQICGKVGIVVNYDKRDFSLPDLGGIAPSDKYFTIHDKAKLLGVTCGDYATFHRYIAHLDHLARDIRKVA